MRPYTYFEPLRRELSRLVLGTFPFMSWPQEKVDELLDAWLEAGGNVVDTAHSYGGGESEKKLGRWLERTGARDELVVITKGANAVEGRPRMNPEAIASDLAESLSWLRTDTIDIYMLHRDDPAAPVAPVLEALNAHEAAGTIRTFGASNWRTERLEVALREAGDRRLEPFSCSSPNLSLARQHTPPFANTVSAGAPEERRWYELRRLPLFAWSSQAGGFFTERHAAADPSEIDPRLVRAYHHDDNFARRERAQELARARGVTATQVALSWVLHQPFPTFPIIGPQSVEELHASLVALDLELTPEEVEWLDVGQRDRSRVQ